MIPTSATPIEPKRNRRRLAAVILSGVLVISGTGLIVATNRANAQDDVEGQANAAAILAAFDASIASTSSTPPVVTSEVASDEVATDAQPGDTAPVANTTVQTTPGGAPIAIATSPGSGSSSGTSTGSTSSTVPAVKTGTVIAKITSEDGSINLPIAEGGEHIWVLNQGIVGRYSMSAPISTAVGNTAITAHRTGDGGPFRSIGDLANDSKLTVTTTDGAIFVYKIVDRQVVLPTDVWVIHPASTLYNYPTLTLIACAHADGTPGGTSNRLVVRAVLVDHTPAP